MNYRERAERHSDRRYARIFKFLKRAPKALAQVHVIQQEPAVEADADNELKALRADYQELVGKRPFHGWHAEELQARINSALSSASDAAE